MTSGPRDPHQIAQDIINDDTDAMEELLKDTEVEDPEADIEDTEDFVEYDSPQSEEDFDGYF